MPKRTVDQSFVNNGDLPLPSGFGINLFGHFGTVFGLGVAAYSIAALLQRRGIPFTLYDVPHGGSLQPFDERFASYRATAPEQLIHPINLYATNSTQLPFLFKENPEFLVGDRMHVANIWWEASQFPRHLLEPFARFDAILAFSDFIAEVSRNSLPLTPVLCGAYPLHLPSDIKGDRREFGVPDDAVLFVASLDPNSDPARKNPTALVIAFRAAFPPEDTGVRLVIRLNHATSKFGRQVVRELRQLMYGDGRIELLLQPMEYEQVLSLYACADVYLSLHRAEGLGLGMLESMTLGKVVMATGWSGNMSFMDYGNGVPLRYRLVPVAGTYEFYRSDMLGPDARWAEPMLDDTVAWMRKLRHDPVLRRSLEARAECSALAYRQKAEAAGWLSELAALWQARCHLPSIARKFSSSDEALRSDHHE